MTPEPPFHLSAPTACKHERVYRRLNVEPIPVLSITNDERDAGLEIANRADKSLKRIKNTQRRGL